ncbi:MAG: hypothetical protein H7Y18_09060 [Clostridiaceae bacterium]|nr:hypothetical protein [Clostridiaceae bacterium]
MMNDKLLLMSTRLKIPQVRKNYIVREELFSMLDRINEYSVILIKGGAGTGKTTLITSFAKEKGISNLKWIALDESCNNVFLFWNYFIETVGDYLGAGKQDFISLYDSNFQKSNLEQLITLLINRLDNQEDIFIVLDDFYYITDSFLLHTIDFFLKNVSDNIHIILLTRQEPLLYLGAINMKGRLLVMNETDLKLPLESGIRFLKDTLKFKLKLETLDFMNNLSEGWIGGLQLVAAVAGGKNETEIMRLNLDNRLIEGYLTKEIYDFLEPSEKEFLVVTSMLSYFNEALCIKMLDNFQFKKVMDSLLQKNILIICIDEKNEIYRYHNILKEYLKGIFKGLNKKTQTQFHRKAAEVLEKLGDYNQCIDQLLHAEDYESAMKLIIELPNNATLFSYVDCIPKKVITKNSDFAYQCFFYYYVNIEFEKCKELYEALKDNTYENQTFSAFRFSNMFVEDTYKLNEIDVLPISKIDKLPLKETTKALILIKDASFLHVQCKYYEALKFIDKAMSYLVIRSNYYIVFFCFSIKSQILEDMGELNKCADLYKEMNKILESNEGLSMLTASFYIGIIGIYLKQMDLKKAENYLKSAEQYLSDSVLSINRGYIYNLAEYKFIIGETDEALEMVKGLLNMESFNNPVYLAPLLKYVFKLNRFSGELVQRFIEGYKSLEEINRSLDSKLLYANILLKAGEVELAMKLTDEILKYSRMHKIKLKLVQASLFKINMIYETIGRKRDIINLLREAIFYSYEDSILNPYFFEAEVVAKVIKQYESDLYNDLSLAEKEHYKKIMNLCKIGTKAILSEREIDVLNEIANGESNKVIAEHLCISLATVKSHIINIYSKLQVNNRVAAIEASKRYGII